MCHAVPELPEVETVRGDLEARVVGRCVVRASVTGARTVRRQRPTELCAALEGRAFSAIRRKGKYLLAGLDDGAVLVVHLRMSGQLRLVPAGEHAGGTAPHTHAVLGLDDASELRFVDPRTFGELFVTSEIGPDGVPTALSGLGVDPITDGLDAARLATLLRSRHTALKAFLLDQRGVAGIGNIYADEICFAARLRPDRRTESLRPDEVSRLRDAVLDVLAAAVAHRGSTLRDERYRDLGGARGSYQDHHAVYGRAGEPCLRCATVVVGSRVAGRSAHFCPSCQS